MDCDKPNKVLHKKPELVYLIRCGEFNLYKIGRSNISYLKNRLMGLQGGCPFELNILAKKITDQSVKLELQLHKQFWNSRKRGEWFELTDKQVEDIMNILL